MATDGVIIPPLYNGEADNLVQGEIVRASTAAANRAVRAQGDSAANVQGVLGVVVSGVVGPTGPVIVESVGRQRVLMDAALAPTPGMSVYVSGTNAGRGTTLIPANAVRIGIIVDATYYTIDGSVVVALLSIGDSLTFTGDFITLDSVNTGGTTLTGLASAGFTEGVLAWVNSVGDYFRLKDGSALTVDNLTVVPASGRAGAQWIRCSVMNLAWAARTTWSIDPVNGVDDQSGGDVNATALKTISELRRRLWGARLKTTVNVTVLGAVPSSDAGRWNTEIDTGFTLVFTGTLGAVTGYGGAAIDNTLYTGSVTGFTAAANAPTADDIQLTDAAIPVSFTASGLLASGVVFRRTVPSTLNWYALKDLGAKTIRITAPMSTASVGMNSALVVGQAYSAYAMWTMSRQDFGVEAPRVLMVQLVDTGASGASSATISSEAGMIGVSVGRRTVWVQGNTRLTTGIGAISQNVLFEQSTAASKALSLFSQAYRPGSTGQISPSIQGGGARGDSTTGTLNFFTDCTINGAFIVQGMSLGCYGKTLQIESEIAVHDTTQAALIAQQGGRITFNPTTAGTGLSGKDNTSKLVSATNGGYFAWGTNSATPPMIAGSTTDANPITIGTTNYTVAALPALSQVELCAMLPFPYGPQAVANGGVAVAWNNAPAGSPAAPVRHVAFPDGAGGFFTVPSVT